MNNGAHYNYKKRQIEGEKQGRLIIMLYDGAIKFLTIAKEAIDENDVETSHNNLIRGQALIAELINSLKVDVGEVAVNLLRLYEFMNRQLSIANAKKDTNIIDSVIKLLKSLRAGWLAVIKKLQEENKGEKPKIEEGKDKETKINPVNISI
jgi:flagellar protein FliS